MTDVLKKITTADLAALAERFNESKIVVVFEFGRAHGYITMPDIYHFPTNIIVRQDELLDAVNDPDKYAARHFKVSKAHYQQWARLIQNPECAALTQKGLPCKGGIQRMPQVPNEYNPDVPLFCAVHNDRTQNVTLIDKA